MAVSYFISAMWNVKRNVESKVFDVDVQIYHWIYGLCPSSGILSSYETQCFGSWVSFRLQVTEERYVLCWVFNKDVQWLRLALSKGHNREGVCFLSPEHRNKSSFRTIVLSSYLEFRTMEEIHKICDSEYSILFAEEVLQDRALIMQCRYHSKLENWRTEQTGTVDCERSSQH
jgi:hypothetical protein